jgi:hypothetical protein
MQKEIQLATKHIKRLSVSPTLKKMEIKLQKEIVFFFHLS